MAHSDSQTPQNAVCPTRGGPMIAVSAAVKYIVTNLGIGVEFLDLSPADVTRIDVYVTKGQLGR